MSADTPHPASTPTLAASPTPAPISLPNPPPMILIGLASETFFLIPRPATLQDAVIDAKDLLDLHPDSHILLLTEVEGTMAAMTESTWSRLDLLPLIEKIRKIQVKVVEEQSKMGKRKREKEDIDSGKGRKSVKRDSKANADGAEDSDTDTEQDSAKKREYSVEIVEPYAKAVATDNELTSLCIRTPLPCGAKILEITCDPRTTTLETVREQLLEQHKLHDPIKCVQLGNNCADELHFKFDHVEEPSSYDIVVNDWLEMLRSECPDLPSYQNRRLATEGWMFACTYA